MSFKKLTLTLFSLLLFTALYRIFFFKVKQLFNYFKTSNLYSISLHVPKVFALYCI